jgi:hypothetical protein
MRPRGRRDVDGRGVSAEHHRCGLARAFRRPLCIGRDNDEHAADADLHVSGDALPPARC